MKAIITAVAFDFTSDDGIEDMPSAEEQQDIIASVIGKAYDLGEDYIYNDIADAISDDTGWCVLDVQYKLVDNSGANPYGFGVYVF